MFDHQTLCRCLDLAVSYDQLCVSNLSLETLVRRLVTIGGAYRGRPDAPNYEHAEYMSGIRVMEKRADLATKRREAHGERKHIEKSLLEMRPASASTRSMCLKKESEFWEFMKAKGLGPGFADHPAPVDRAMVQYADFLYLQGGAVDTLEKVKAAWEAIHDDYGRRGHVKLPRLARALHCFRRLAPRPLPRNVCSPWRAGSCSADCGRWRWSSACNS